MGFVFSHFGVRGNVIADRIANKARLEIGNQHSHYAYYDTIRVDLREMHQRWHVALRNRFSTTSFRFKHVFDQITSESLHANNKQLMQQRCNKETGQREVIGVIHQNIPRREISRLEEKRLFAARLGMIREICGFFHGEFYDCPFCNEKEALGRSGKTSTHLLENCVGTAFIRNNNNYCPILWNNPVAAVGVLNKIIDLYSLFFPKSLNLLTVNEKENYLRFYERF
jgi:hypothetical protein